MRIALLSLAVLLVGCGASPPPARRARVARAPQLEPGTRFDIERIAEERLDGALRATRHERLYVSIGARQPDGGYAARALRVVVQGQDRIGRILYDVRLAPDLTLRGDPVERCEDLPDELAPERVLRHVLGAVPRTRTRGEYEGEHWSDLREEPLRARAEVRRDRDRLRVRAQAQLALEGDAIAGVLATGSARVRVIANVDRTWLVGEVRSRIEARATVRDPSGRVGPVPGRIRIDETITTTRTTGDVPSDQTCERRGDFDVRQVTNMIRERQAEIRACYERELERDATLAGSVSVSMTIEESGRTTDVRVTESTLPPAAGRCVVRVLDSFSFDPGPEGGSVTYAFPLVFEPRPSQRPPEAGSAEPVIRTRQAAIRACYEEQLRADPNLGGGTLRIRMTIEPTGEVTGVSTTENTLPGPRGEAVAACVIAIIGRFRFDPGPDHRVTYAFPFMFEPQ